MDRNFPNRWNSYHGYLGSMLQRWFWPGYFCPKSPFDTCPVSPVLGPGLEAISWWRVPGQSSGVGVSGAVRACGWLYHQSSLCQVVGEPKAWNDDENDVSCCFMMWSGWRWRLEDEWRWRRFVVFCFPIHPGIHFIYVKILKQKKRSDDEFFQQFPQNLDATFEAWYVAETGFTGARSCWGQPGWAKDGGHRLMYIAYMMIAFVFFDVIQI